MRLMPYANEALWTTFGIGIFLLVTGLGAAVYGQAASGLLVALIGGAFVVLSYKLGNMPVAGSPDGK